MVDLRVDFETAGRQRIEWFRSGQVRLSQSPLVRPITYYSHLDYFRGQVGLGLGYPPPLNFIYGEIEIDLPRPRYVLSTGGVGYDPINGRVRIVAGGMPLAGAITGFSFTKVGEGDPDGLVVEHATANVSAELDDPWIRHVAVFTPPVGARYLGIGGLFEDMPVSAENRYQHLKMVQVESLPVSEGVAPSTYTAPREIQALIKPDRLNWSANPSAYRDTSNWTGVTRSHRITDLPKWAAQVSIAAGATATVTHTIPLLRKNTSYVVSVRLFSAGGTTTLVASASAPVGARKVPGAIGGAETSYQMLVRPTASGPVTITFEATAGASPVRFQFYEVMIEEGENWDQPYFDGYTGGSDYLWEAGEVPGTTRSYYYKNLNERKAVVKRILEDNVPLGIGIAEPQFAVMPSVTDIQDLVDPEVGENV